MRYLYVFLIIVSVTGCVRSSQEQLERFAKLEKAAMNANETLKGQAPGLPISWRREQRHAKLFFARRGE